jgi:hypothetical protein
MSLMDTYCWNACRGTDITFLNDINACMEVCLQNQNKIVAEILHQMIVSFADEIAGTTWEYRMYVAYVLLGLLAYSLRDWLGYPFTYAYYNHYADTVSLETRTLIPVGCVVYDAEGPKLPISIGGKRYFVRTSQIYIPCSRNNPESSENRGYVDIDEMAIPTSSAIYNKDLPNCMAHLICGDIKEPGSMKVIGGVSRIDHGLLTCHHVWRELDGREVYIRGLTGKTVLFNPNWPIYFESEDLDVIVVEVPQACWSVLGVSKAELKPALNGALISLSGYDENGMRMTTKGRMSKDKGPFRFTHTASSRPSWSGSPIMFNKTIVGMHLGARPSGNVNRGVSLNLLLDVDESDVTSKESMYREIFSDQGDEEWPRGKRGPTEHENRLAEQQLGRVVFRVKFRDAPKLVSVELSGGYSITDKGLVEGNWADSEFDLDQERDDSGDVFESGEGLAAPVKTEATKLQSEINEAYAASEKLKQESGIGLDKRPDFLISTPPASVVTVPKQELPLTSGMSSEVMTPSSTQSGAPMPSKSALKRQRQKVKLLKELEDSPNVMILREGVDYSIIPGPQPGPMLSTPASVFKSTREPKARMPPTSSERKPHVTFLKTTPEPISPPTSILLKNSGVKLDLKTGRVATPVRSASMESPRRLFVPSSGRLSNKAPQDSR